MIFDIKDEFLFDNFEWLLGYFTLDNSYKQFIDIFLSYFKPYDFFIILINGKRFIKRPNIGVLVFSIMPAESSFFCF